jgi:hypothetical protein
LPIRPFDALLPESSRDVVQAVVSAGLQQVAHLSSEVLSLPSLVPDNQLGGSAGFRIQVSQGFLAISPPGAGGEG